jgi:hypothetical protein
MAVKASISVQTLYAELVDRCASAAFESEFPPNGSFVRVRVKDRSYWYFQQGARDHSGRQPRKYVGRDDEGMRRRIAEHGRKKDDYRERRRLISMLRRSGFHGPSEAIGRILESLSAAGVFRRRVCLVGTTAYGVYGPMLGVRLPRSSLQTLDLDIAQFRAVSMAIAKDDQTLRLLDLLQRSDPSFRSIPHVRKAAATTSYINDDNVRVDVLTENRGPESEAPTALPAIGAHAQPLRFMDFLIRDELQAVVLHDAGVLVNVPAPERFALHKLIVAQRRTADPAKADKDVEQAAALLRVLVARRHGALRAAWQEASSRGAKWQELLANGLGMVEPTIRDHVLHVVGATRRIIPGLDLTFGDQRPRYDVDRDAVLFFGESGDAVVACAISREALEDHFNADGQTKAQRLETFRRNRAAIERMARELYRDGRVALEGPVLIKTSDVLRLRPTRQSRRKSPGDRR